MKKIINKIKELENNLKDFSYLENNSDDDIRTDENMLAYLKGYLACKNGDELAYKI